MKYLKQSFSVDSDFTRFICYGEKLKKTDFCKRNYFENGNSFSKKGLLSEKRAKISFFTLISNR